MILDRIVADNRIELEKRKNRVPLAELKQTAAKQPPAKDLALALCGDGIRLIAEIKKASPSRGVIRADLDPVKTAQIYAANGASAISILTETKYFQGDLTYLRMVREAMGKQCPPLLRKDFLWEPYQLYESRAYGADALLLIVAILKPEQLKELLELSHRLGMKCLVEVHNETEVEIAVKCGARIIGINNRDLTDFTVDLDTTRQLRPLIPEDRLVVSESGIKDRRDVEKLKEWGVNAILVGESLVVADDIAAKIRSLL